MRKFIIASLIVSLTVAMASCAANPRCEWYAVHSELAEAEEEVYAYVYGEDKGYEIDGKVLSDMLSGKWEKGSRPEGEKLLSVTVGTQYEICLFENGQAMVYCGYAGILEKDRSYYTYEIDEKVEDICTYIMNNGTEVELEEDGSAADK